jgi:HD-like signal output (HDOD) protein/prolyl-tRNA editing enzyme YbaK/EbsC (Cys-tRNA(Pro) deacylase)
MDTLLRKQNITYEVLEPVAGPQHETVLTTLLGDSDGARLQAIFSADTLLDLNRLNRLTGHHWRALAAAEVNRLCGQHQLQSLPALPASLGIPAIVDQHLLERPALTLPCGDDQRLLQLDAEQFRRALASATVAEFATPVEELAQPQLAAVDDVTDISRAVASFTQLRMKQRLDETLEIPPLPGTAQRIIQLRVDPHADLRDLVNVVELDPALAAQVVSWASSPYYAAPGRIESVQDAIGRILGFDLVLNLALGLALGKSLALPRDTPRNFTPYWKQAVYAATATEALVGCIPSRHRPGVGIAYLCGLLHNFGLLLLAHIFPPHFTSYCRHQEANPHLDPLLVERFLLGVDRNQLAAWLMRLWGMPEEVSLALRHQGDPDHEGAAADYAGLLFITTQLLRGHGIGGTPPLPIPEALWARLHLDPELARQALATVMEASAEINAISAGLAA